jgi:hypothetical protein
VSAKQFKYKFTFVTKYIRNNEIHYLTIRINSNTVADAMRGYNHHPDVQDLMMEEVIKVESSWVANDALANSEL